jgi:hypothetical protein
LAVSQSQWVVARGNANWLLIQPEKPAVVTSAIVARLAPIVDWARKRLAWAAVIVGGGAATGPGAGVLDTGEEPSPPQAVRVMAGANATRRAAVDRAAEFSSARRSDGGRTGVDAGAGVAAIPSASIIPQPPERRGPEQAA